MRLKEIKYEDVNGIYLAWDTFQERVLVNAVRNRRLPLKKGSVFVGE